MNWKFMEATHIMLQHNGLNRKIWAKVVNTTIYFKTKSLHKVVNGITLEQLWSGRNLPWALWRFGCTTRAQKLDMTRTKLKPKNTKCVFVRYNLNSKGYKFIEKSTIKLFISWNVTFHELTMKNGLLMGAIIGIPVVGNMHINLEFQNDEEVGVE